MSERRVRAVETETVAAASNDDPFAIRDGNTVSERLAGLAGLHIKIVGEFPVPVRPHFGPDHRMTARDWRALNWAYVDRATNAAKSAINTGAQKGKSDAEKVAYLTSYLNGGYQFTDDLGSEFSSTLLELAADRVRFAALKAAGQYSKSYSDHNSTAEREVRAAAVKMMLTSSDTASDGQPLADKYTPLVLAAVQEILAERHEVQTRTARPKVEPTAVPL